MPRNRNRQIVTQLSNVLKHRLRDTVDQATNLRDTDLSTYSGRLCRSEQEGPPLADTSIPLWLQCQHRLRQVETEISR